MNRGAGWAALAWGARVGLLPIGKEAIRFARCRINRRFRLAGYSWAESARGILPPGGGQRKPDSSGLRGGLGSLALRADADDVPCESELLERPDHPGRGIELPRLHPVDRRGRKGVVAVVPGLAEGGQREPREVARLVGGLEIPLAEHVAERVDRVGDVVEDEDPHRAAPEEAG